MIVEGKMQYLFDETGRRYLDVSATACVAVYHASKLLAHVRHSAWQHILTIEAYE